MSAPVTHGRLLDAAVDAMAGVEAVADVSFADVDQALDAFMAWRRCVSVLVRYLVLLAPHDPVVASLPRLRAARTPHPDGALCVGSPPVLSHPALPALTDAAASVAAAHDVLATHLGPERQHRTPDAALIDAAGVDSPTGRMASGLLLTAAMAGAAIEARAGEVPDLAGRLSAPRHRLRRETDALLGPAAESYDRAIAAVSVDADTLTDLGPAPVLSAPGSDDDDPTIQLDDALARIRVAVHRQGRGELPAGATSIRAVSAVALGLLHHHSVDPTGRASAGAVAPAAEAWNRVHDLWGQLSTLSGGTRGVCHDAIVALHALDDIDIDRGTRGTAPGATTCPVTARQWRWLPEMASLLDRVAARLGHERQILVPIGWCDNPADVSHSWATAESEHLDLVSSHHAATIRASRTLSQGTGWSPHRDPAGGAAVAETAALRRIS